MTKQLDADNIVNEQVTEIPAEYADQFEGVSKETALEVLREAGLLQEKQTGPAEDDPGEGTGPEDNKSGQASDDQTGKQAESGQAKTGEQEAVKQPDVAKPDEGKPDETKPNETKPDDDPEKHGDVRVALKIERQKRQQLQAELERLKAGAQPPTVHPLQGQQPQVQPNQNATTYEDLLHNEAMRRFEARYGRKPDIYDPDNATAEIAKFNVIIRQVDDDVRQLQAQEAERQGKQTAVNNDYGVFVSGLMADDLYEANKQKVVQAIEALDPDTQNLIVNAAQRLETGKGTRQDLFIAQTFWNQTVGSKPAGQAQEQTGQSQKQEVTVTPVPTQVNKMEKAKQMEAHPRTDQIKGSNTQGGYTVAELERLLREKEWDDIPKDIQKLLLGS